LGIDFARVSPIPTKYSLKALAKICLSATLTPFNLM